MPEETDDFANDKQIEKLRQEQKEYDEMIAECMRVIREQLSLEPSDGPDIGAYHLFNALDGAAILDVFRSTRDDLPIEVFRVQYRWSLHAGKMHASGLSECFLGLLSLSREYPFTFIYRETLNTKITDWFTKQDVDFKEQGEFSGRFHVMTQDKDRLQTLLLNRPLDVLADYPEMEVEINGSSCLFKVSGRPISKSETNNFIELARRLYKIFS